MKRKIQNIQCVCVCEANNNQSRHSLASGSPAHNPVKELFCVSTVSTVSTSGCCESWGSVSCGSGIGQGGPQLHPQRPAPSWMSDPRCCRCTTSPSLPGRTAPVELPNTPADPQSLVPGSPTAQRPPTAGMWHPAGPAARQTPGPAYSGTNRHIWVPLLPEKEREGKVCLSLGHLGWYNEYNTNGTVYLYLLYYLMLF